MLTLHFVPQPIAEQDCVRQICLEGQLIRVNQTQHCPQGAVRPRCGVLGLAVRVGGDRCCPQWECACELWDQSEPLCLFPTPACLCVPSHTSAGNLSHCDSCPDKFPSLMASELCETPDPWNPPAPRVFDSPAHLPGGLGTTRLVFVPAQADAQSSQT